MKKKKRGLLSRIRLVHVILILVVVYMISGITKQMNAYNELSAKKTELEKEISSLEKDITGLEEEIENSDSLEFIEKIAREELGMVKPREIIYIDKDKVNDTELNMLKRENN